MKKRTKAVILCLLPISSLALLFLCLETYYPHNEYAMLVCGYAVLAFILSSKIAMSELENKSSSQITAAIFAVSCVIFAFVFCVGYKIPFCASCDDVSASELGFLTHWIEPSDIR